LKAIYLFIVLLFSVSCKNETKENHSKPIEGTSIILKYAKGFSITDFGTHKILEIKNPWTNADISYSFTLTSNKLYQDEKNRDALITPLKKIVVTSTTHLPALELLNVEDALIGFPGTTYISSKTIRQRVDKGFIRELGKNENINTEILLELNPEVVIAFGIDDNNKTLETIKKSEIPVIFNGDWVEDSPLARAEWIKFFGVLFDKEKKADSIFNRIEANYLDAKKIASKVLKKPTVLSGALHKDIWYLPNGNSTEAQLLKDANTNYLWSNSKGTGSLTLNFETVFEIAKYADFWFSPSNYSSLEILEKANSHYASFKAFQNKAIYSFNNTQGESGGNLYYELGMTRPDIVLKDIIKICHPELLQNYEPFFFKPLK
jgi:iron complex transport system substrate-binding protein